ncbi:RluA family pseudouridine synthase [Mesoaciditoga lauensis]|uniref:RluA family pseudouridine synthase n=1 Tax=Mesoaciditoga lauensis TaxID=1495039 RepID=UPI0006902770|nr:RluA family pseudouridine synthase [Mesoaciditoga lauensis]
MKFYFQEITADRQEERLDKFLRRSYPEIRMAVLQKFIRSGKVVVDGTRIKDGSYRLKTGQRVLIKVPGNQDEIKQRYGRTPPEHIPLKMNLDVIYEDEYMLAINKPVGIPVQPGTKTFNSSIYNVLLSYNSEFYLVHRLDKYTSGVLLVSKKYEFTKELADLFQSHNLEKRYIALVYGLVKNDLKIKSDLDGKEAVTFARPIEFFNGYTLLEVEILTGRKHQIRRHLAFNETPIVGDDVYGNVEINKEFKKKYGLEGYFLHCSEMSFVHPKKKKNIIIKAPLPQKRKQILEALRK